MTALPPRRAPQIGECVPGPEEMRDAVGRYVAEVHRAYLAQADTFPPAVRGRMPLLRPGGFRVAAVGARNLHLLATVEELGPLRGQEVELPGELPGLHWWLRFYDPVVIPELGLVDESSAPAYAQVKGAIGVRTVLYHLVAQPGSGLTLHHATHVGSGLAGAHSALARDFDAIRAAVRGRSGRGSQDIVDELEGAAVAGLRRAQALLARVLAPRDPVVAELADSTDPDPDAVRKALLAHLRGDRLG